MPTEVRLPEKLACRLEEIGFDASIARKKDSLTVIGDSRTVTPESGNEGLQLPPLRVASDDAAGDLVLSSTLGEGGMGIVRRASQVALHRDVAVKTIKPDLSDDLAYFLIQEAWTTGNLEHPNVVPVYTLGQGEDGLPILVMKKISGVAWDEVMANSSRWPGEFTGIDNHLERHLRVLMHVASAVHFAHSRGVIHRDLKPPNVMVGHFGEVFLVDWGIALAFNDDAPAHLQRASEIEGLGGTLEYMAPEMAAAEGHLFGPHTDVYQLGAMLHEVLTGNPPHRASSVEEALVHAFESPAADYGPEVPRELADICHRAMAPEPAERYQSAADFRHALASFIEHRSARNLVREAASRLARLGELIDAEDEPRKIYDTFAEARFGFQQALSSWGGSKDARRGLELTLERMIRFEISRGAPDAAAAYLASLPSMRPDLEAEIQELIARQAEQQQADEELKKRGREADAGRGKRQRAWLMTTLAVLLLALGGSFGLLTKLGVHAFGYTEVLAALGGILAVFTAVGLKGRVMASNKINRRMFLGALGTNLCIISLVVMCWFLGLELYVALSLQLLLLAAVSLQFAMMADWRLIRCSASFFAGFLLVPLLSEWALELYGVCNLFGFGLAALIWRR